MTTEEFTKLYTTDCSKYIEKKDCGNGRSLSYLSWAWAWAKFAEVYPDAVVEVVKDGNGLPYFAAPTGIMVYTRVTAGGVTREMWLPVMDAANKAMRLEPHAYQVYNKLKKCYEEKYIAAADMFDINKTIMRCMTKNIALFGIGLSIYAGEDIPQPLTAEEQESIEREYEAKQKAKSKVKTTTKKQDEPKRKQDDEKRVMTMEEYRNGGLAPVVDWFVKHYDANIADIPQADIDKIHTSYYWEDGLFDLVVAEARQKAFQQDLNS